MFFFLLVFALATQVCLAKDEVLQLQRVSHSPMTRIGNVGYEVCAEICCWWSCTTYYCPGDTICCTPGTPDSLCCPEDHPLCVAEDAVQRAIPKCVGTTAVYLIASAVETTAVKVKTHVATLRIAVMKQSLVVRKERLPLAATKNQWLVAMGE